MIRNTTTFFHDCCSNSNTWYLLSLLFGLDISTLIWKNPFKIKPTHEIFYHILNFSLQNIKPHNDNFSANPSQKKLPICFILTVQRQILVQITHHKIVGQGNSGSSSSFLLEKPKVRLVSLVIGLGGHNSALLTGFQLI